MVLCFLALFEATALSSLSVLFPTAQTLTSASHTPSIISPNFRVHTCQEALSLPTLAEPHVLRGLLPVQILFLAKPKPFPAAYLTNLDRLHPLPSLALRQDIHFPTQGWNRYW